MAKKYVRADLSGHPLDVRLTPMEGAMMTFRRDFEMTARAIAEAGLQSRPRILFVQKIVEGVTVTIEINGQAQEEAALLEGRIDAAITEAVKVIKRKAEIKRGRKPNRKRKDATTSQEFKAKFLEAVRKAQEQNPQAEQLRVPMIAKHYACSARTLSRYCSQFFPDPENEHFARALRWANSLL